jgi:hypothetical protein
MPASFFIALLSFVCLILGLRNLTWSEYVPELRAYKLHPETNSRYVKRGKAQLLVWLFCLVYLIASDWQGFLHSLVD